MVTLATALRILSLPLLWYCPCSTLDLRVLFLGRSDFSGLQASVTLQLAEEALRADNILPSAVKIKCLIEPTCDPHVSPGRAAQIYAQTGLDAIIGPGCYDGILPTGKLSAFWNIPILDYSVASSELTDRRLFPTLVAMTPSMDYLGVTVVKILTYFEWNRVVLLGFQESTGVCQSSLTAVRSRLWASRNTTIAMDITLPNMNNDTLDDFFDSLRSKSRVIITCMLMGNDDPHLNTRRLMIRAQQRGFAAPAYQYIALFDKRKKIEDTLEYAAPWLLDSNDATDSSSDAENSLAMKAFKAVMMVETDGTTASDMDLMIQSLRARTMQPPYNMSFLSVKRMFSKTSWTAPFAYDAMYAYGMAVNISLTKQGSLVNGTELLNYFKAMKFTSKTAQVRMDSSAVRIASYRVSTVDCGGNFSQYISIEPRDWNNNFNNLNNNGNNNFNNNGNNNFNNNGNNRLNNRNNNCNTYYNNNNMCNDDGSNDTVIYRLRFLREQCWATQNNQPPSGEVVMPTDSSTKAQANGLWNILYAGLLLVIIGIVALAGFYYNKRKQKSNALAYAALDGHFWNMPFKELLLLKTCTDRLADSLSDFKGHEDHWQRASLRLSTSRGTMRKYDGGLITVQDAVARNYFSERYAGYGVLRKKLTKVEIYAHKEHVVVSDAERQQIGQMRMLQHENVNSLLACSFDMAQALIFVWDCPDRGSFKSILFKEELQLDSVFQISMIKDVIRGLDYIHNSPVGVHGCLNLDTCLIDNRWTVKLSRFGVANIVENLERRELIRVPVKSGSDLLHLAPECLRTVVTASTWADMYAFAMILYEILFRVEVFHDLATNEATPVIVQKIKQYMGKGDPPRPTLPPIGSAEPVDHAFYYDLMRRCWHESPMLRLTAKQVKDMIYERTRNQSQNLMDHMIEMLGRYASNLENIVEERTQQLQEEKRRADALLCRMLPPTINKIGLSDARSVAADLKMGRAISPELFELVTIFFSDIVEFTALSAVSTPFQMVTMLNLLYSTVDAVIANYDAYKVETIGDAYMIVSGLPKRNGYAHATEIANLALDIRKVFQAFVIPHMPNRGLELRIGIHSGSVAAGVIGQSMPRYCLFGDTVNMASRMESSGLPMKIHVSADTHNLLSNHHDYSFVCRGLVQNKGKGECVTYWLEAAEHSAAAMQSHLFLV